MSDDFGEEFISITSGYGLYKFFVRLIWDQFRIGPALFLTIIMAVVFRGDWDFVLIMPGILFLYFYISCILMFCADSLRWGNVISHLDNAPTTKLGLSDVRNLLPPPFYLGIKQAGSNIMRTEPVYIFHPEEEVDFDLPCGYTAFGFFLLSSVIVCYINPKSMDDGDYLQLFHEIGHVSSFQTRLMKVPLDCVALALTLNATVLWFSDGLIIELCILAGMLLGAFYIAIFNRKASRYEYIADAFGSTCFMAHMAGKISSMTIDEIAETHDSAVSNFIDILANQPYGFFRQRYFKWNKKYISDYLEDWSRYKGPIRQETFFRAAASLIKSFYVITIAQYLAIICVSVCALLLYTQINFRFSLAVMGFYLTVTLIFGLLPLIVDLFQTRERRIDDSILFGDEAITRQIVFHNGMFMKYAEMRLFNGTIAELRKRSAAEKRDARSFRDENGKLSLDKFITVMVIWTVDAVIHITYVVPKFIRFLRRSK